MSELWWYAIAAGVFVAIVAVVVTVWNRHEDDR